MIPALDIDDISCISLVILINLKNTLGKREYKISPREVIEITKEREPWLRNFGAMEISKIFLDYLVNKRCAEYFYQNDKKFIEITIKGIWKLFQYHKKYPSVLNKSFLK